MFDFEKYLMSEEKKIENKKERGSNDH
jgi:hypothetical protein